MYCNNSVGTFSLSIFLDCEGSVWVCGKVYDLLNINSSIPTKINDLPEIKSVSCGQHHAIFCDYDGNAFCIGKSKFGALGIGKKNTEMFKPQKINIPPINQVNCGFQCSICTTIDETVYSFGENKHGQLGLGNFENVYEPQEIPNLTDVEFIETAAESVFCKTYNGDIYSWGYGGNGQLGLGNEQKFNEPQLCKNWPNEIISIKSGRYHILILTIDGIVYSCGDNNSGQLGLGRNTKKVTNPTKINNLPKIKRIACGLEKSACIDENQSLWVFGSNVLSQLGLGHKNNEYEPTKNNKLEGIIDISSGGFHTFVKTDENKIYGFGYNGYTAIQATLSTISNPVEVFIGKESIWKTNFFSKQKSARK